MKSTYSPHNQDRSQKIDQLVPGFTGVRNSADPATIGDTDLADNLNVQFDQTNAMEMRKGTAKLLTTSLAGGILGMHPFYDSANSIKKLIYASVDHQYHYDNAGGSTSVSGTLSSGRRWQYATSHGKTFAADGFGGLYQYTGAGSFTLALGTYPFVNIFFFKNRLWAYEADSSILRYSEAGNPSSFPVNNFIEMNTSDNQVITGLFSDVDQLQVHKTETVWIVTGEPVGSGADTSLTNLQIRQANSDVGTVSQRTISKVTNGIYIFAASDGLYVMQNGKSENVSSFDIERTFKEDMNPNYLHLCWGNYNRTEKKYLFGYPSSTATSCDKVIMMDLSTPGQIQYAIWDNMPGSCAVNFRFAEGKDTTLIGHPTKGFVYEAYTGYADLSPGDNGTSTGSNTSTTLKDTTKAWGSNVHKDSSVTIVEGLGRGQKRVIASHTADTLTLESAWTTTPDTTSVYSIGAYESYGDSKIFNQGRPALNKKYHALDLFTDSQGTYNLQVGVSYNYEPLVGFTEELSLTDGSLIWGQIDEDTGLTMLWGKAGKKWGGKSKLHKRIDLGGDQAKQIQLRIGNDRANQPWRVSQYTITFTPKKNQAD